MGARSGRVEQRRSLSSLARAPRLAARASTGACGMFRLARFRDAEGHMLALHASDSASDEALFQGVQQEARLIL